MKKVILLSVLVLFVFFNVSAQSKSEIKSNGLTGKTVWKYDYKTGKEIKVKESEEKYDAKGNIIEESSFDEYGKLDEKIKYTLNENGDIIKEVYFNSGGKITKTIKYKYEGKLKVEKVVYDSNDKIKSKKVYEYQK